MARRTIQSPGVEIRESDLSLRTVSQGTTTYVTGFAHEGPTDEVVGVTDINNFEQIYGMPRTPAERYFYYTVKATLNSTGSVLVNRLPYGDESGAGFGSKISVLAYPAAGITTASTSTTYTTTSAIDSANFLESATLSAKYTADITASSTLSEVDYLDIADYATTSLGGLLSGSDQETFTTAEFFTSANVVTPGVPTADYSESSATWFIGKPKQFELTYDQYVKLKDGELFADGWSEQAGDSTWNSINALSSAAILVVNKAQTVIDGQFNGYYIGIADNTNINPAQDYDSITSVQTVTQSAGSIGLLDYTTIPETRLEFALSATDGEGTNPAASSVSQVMEDRITDYNIGDDEFNDSLNVGVFKLRQSVFSKTSNRLDYLLEEGFNGSIGKYRNRNSTSGGLPVNYFLETQEDNSRNIDILVNPYLSDQIQGVQLNDDGSPKRKVRVVTDTLYRALNGGDLTEAQVGATVAQLATISSDIGKADSLFALGAYGEVKLGEKVIGKIPNKLDRALLRIKNDEKFNIDMIAEGGLGTIFTYLETATAGLKAAGFDDTRTTDAIEALRTSNDISNSTARDAYGSIFNRFNTFCGPVKDGGRGDVLFIADPIRQILVTGKNNKVQDNKEKNFYTDIYWGMRHQFENSNTSYACTYANYMKVYDKYTGLFVYVPPSGFAAAKMASTDAAVGPWGAPAGFNRGIINDAVDIALTPNQRQRDDLYTVNLNPIASFQDKGNVFFGQKTLLKKPSAFDRVNVRRTFLYLEKITKKTMQFFLFENNTLFTRTRVINTLTPFFERVKASDGLYDYLIVCDERNNTPEVIDQNELIIDIYLKPVRTAEFILVNFYASRTDANFQELIEG